MDTKVSVSKSSKISGMKSQNGKAAEKQAKNFIANVQNANLSAIDIKGYFENSVVSKYQSLPAAVQFKVVFVLLRMILETDIQNENNENYIAQAEQVLMHITLNSEHWTCILTECKCWQN